MITISVTIPNFPAEGILALILVMAPVLLWTVFRLAAGTASLVRHVAK
jgi:hypothetical protein